MKYCSSCKRIVPDGVDVCDVCNNKSTDINSDSIVIVTTVKGKAVSIIDSALKDAGVFCSFERTDGNIYNEFNAKVNAESDFRLLVPFEMYGKAFDICAGIGLVKPEDRLVPIEEADTDEGNKTYEEKFEEVNGVKRSTWQMLWIVIFIVAACLLIWGVDWVAEYIKSLF